jgi:hypothetical protein
MPAAPSASSSSSAVLSLSQPLFHFSSIPRSILLTVPHAPLPRSRALLAPACRRPLQLNPCLNAPTHSLDKEIYILQLRERILRQETVKLEAEERVLKARTQAAQATEVADSSMKNYQVRCPRLLTPSVTISGQ